MSDPIPRPVRDKILADYKAGEMTQVAIAKKHKVAPASIYRIITAAGIKRDLTRIPSEAIEAAIEDYVSGDESTASVARRHDLSADTLQRHLRERGLNRPSASQSNGLRDAVVDDYAGGLTSGEVARKHGVSASTVVAWSRAAGIEIRSPGQPALDDEPLVHEGQWVRRGLVMVSTASRSELRRKALLAAVLEETGLADVEAESTTDDELTCARRRRALVAEFATFDNREKGA